MCLMLGLAASACGRSDLLEDRQNNGGASDEDDASTLPCSTILCAPQDEAQRPCTEDMHCSFWIYGTEVCGVDGFCELNYEVCDHVEGAVDGECGDCLDNDQNGLSDCNDPGCSDAPECDGSEPPGDDDDTGQPGDDDDATGQPGDDDDTTETGGDSDSTQGSDGNGDEGSDSGSSGGNNGGSNGTDDDTDTGSDTPFGPSNSWWHANTSDVPSNLWGTGWSAGNTAYDFTAVDQFGDTVQLYQFYGQVILIDIFAFW